MLELPVTSLVAAVLAILMLPLTMQVSLRRASLGKAMGDLAGVAFGDADDDLLKRRIRAFGNFVEYTPMCLLMVALMEGGGAETFWVWIAGGSLVLGRVIHALGMLYSSVPAPRAVGMFLTYIAFVGPAAWLISQA